MQWHLLKPLGNKPFKNTMGKGEIARNEQFLLYPVFSTSLENFLLFTSNSKLLSADCFSVDQSKILSSGNGLSYISLIDALTTETDIWLIVLLFLWNQTPFSTSFKCVGGSQSIYPMLSCVSLNITLKGENAGYQHFPHFRLCFNSFPNKP